MKYKYMKARSIAVCAMIEEANEKGEDIRIVDIAEAMKLSRQAISQTVMTLERKGLVRKDYMQRKNGRNYSLKLLDKGYAAE